MIVVKILESQAKLFKILLIQFIEPYQYHPSIVIINKKVDNQNKFSFESVFLSDLVKEIKDVNFNKSSTEKSITPKTLKISFETAAHILQNLLNDY